jgi:hypothetical protein
LTCHKPGLRDGKSAAGAAVVQIKARIEVAMTSRINSSWIGNPVSTRHRPHKSRIDQAAGSRLERAGVNPPRRLLVKRGGQAQFDIVGKQLVVIRSLRRCNVSSTMEGTELSGPCCPIR